MSDKITKPSDDDIKRVMEYLNSQGLLQPEEIQVLMDYLKKLSVLANSIAGCVKKQNITPDIVQVIQSHDVRYTAVKTIIDKYTDKKDATKKTQKS